jgi:hypothetical protein
MRKNKQPKALSRLKALLIKARPGPVENTEVEGLLIECWGLLGGSSQEGTTADKLSGRIENLRWQPPYLLFQIERHGGTVMGSSRAEIAATV